MKPLPLFLFAALSLVISSAPAKTPAVVVDPQVMELIKTLARLTDMADACGEHMNFYGKKALKGEVCKEFVKGFYSQWPSREALQEEVADYTTRLEQGEINCDNCRVMLQRVEELRITITYYLDYMDFMKEF